MGRAARLANPEFGSPDYRLAAAGTKGFEYGEFDD
jgi:hypothetical protein